MLFLKQLHDNIHKDEIGAVKKCVGLVSQIKTLKIKTEYIGPYVNITWPGRCFKSKCVTYFTTNPQGFTLHIPFRFLLCLSRPRQYTVYL